MTNREYPEYPDPKDCDYPEDRYDWDYEKAGYERGITLCECCRLPMEPEACENLRVPWELHRGHPIGVTPDQFGILWVQDPFCSECSKERTLLQRVSTALTLLDR